MHAVRKEERLRADGVTKFADVQTSDGVAPHAGLLAFANP
jgi:hypothetical protein